MLSTFLTPAINMKRVGFVASVVVCILLPSLVIGAPANDDLLKQQIASGLLRGDDYWSFNQEPYVDDLLQRLASQYSVRTRSGGLDSLGRGNILRSLDGMGNDWSENKGVGWRLGAYGGAPKRGGGLDSLGRGNILRSVGYEEEVANFLHSLPSAKGRSLDSLGKGNILKRSVRIA